jgi:hypothetical protein
VTQAIETELRQRVAELETENARLRSTLESVKQERKELRKVVFAKAPPSREVSDEEYADMLRNHVPGSGRKFMEDLGIIPRTTS